MAKVIKPVHIKMHMMDFWERRNKRFERRNTFRDVSSIEELSEIIKTFDPDGSKLARIHKEFYAKSAV